MKKRSREKRGREKSQNRECWEIKAPVNFLDGTHVLAVSLQVGRERKITADYEPPKHLMAENFKKTLKTRRNRVLERQNTNG